MKKLILLCTAALALSATVAFAEGVNLSWTDCGLAGAEARSFACTANTGAGTLVGSFIPPAGSTAITGEEIVIDLQSAAATLPAWWQFKNAGTCRQTALSANAGFVSGPFSCADYWAGGASGGLTAFNTNIVPGQTNRARILALFSVPPLAAGPVDDTVEYYAFNLIITNAKTTGTGACAGCLDPVCIVLNEIKLTQPVGVGNYRIQNPADRNFATWQGGGIGQGGCPGATPTKSTTWGSVKALYR